MAYGSKIKGNIKSIKVKKGKSPSIKTSVRGGAAPKPKRPTKDMVGGKAKYPGTWTPVKRKPASPKRKPGGSRRK